MHGIVFTEFRKFVTHHHGEHLWKIINAASGFNGREYLAHKSYHDEELSAILQQACITFSTTPDQLLESFGEFIVPDLLAVYGRTVDKVWKTLDLLENVESVIHNTVRKTDRNADPPKLKISRTSKDHLEIVYQSPRKLEHLGVGIIKGVARHYKEEVRISLSRLNNYATIITVETYSPNTKPTSHDKVSMQVVIH